VSTSVRYPLRHRRPWLPREDRTLRARAVIVPVGAVSARLGRFRPAILARAPSGCTGIAPARREMRLGRHALWLAWDDDLTRFLRDCRPAYDPARIRDPYWRAFVAALPPERDPWLTPGEAAPLLGHTAARHPAADRDGSARRPPLGRALLPPPQRNRPVPCIPLGGQRRSVALPSERRYTVNRFRRRPSEAQEYILSTS